MKILCKIILWLCIIPTALTSTVFLAATWNDLPAFGELFIEEVFQLKDTQKDDSANNNTLPPQIDNSQPDDPSNNDDLPPQIDNTTRSPSKGLAYKKIASGSAYAVIGIGTCSDIVIVIPEEYNGKPVTEIAEKAFYQNKQIVSVQIPQTIQEIGAKAFSGCDNLSSVTLPDKVNLGLDVFRESIYVDIQVSHDLVFVAEKSPNCENAGNIAHYWCEDCNEFFADANGNEKIYNVSLAIAHSFENGICSDCGKVLDEIKIVKIDTIPHLGTFALGTLENAIGLPESINTYTADGKCHLLSVQWELTDYDKSKVGDYTIKGHLQAENLVFADGVSAEVEASIRITEHMKGTADIVFVLDISGSMGDEVKNVKNNIISFATAVEAAGVSARWGAITYSDYLEYPGTLNEQTQIIKDGTSDWFVSAQDYKNAIGNISLANGGDAPETALDGLLLANTMKTRQDVRVFYILLTDAETKTQNHYGVTSISGCAEMLNSNGVNVSVITNSGLYSHYNSLYDTTGGIVTNITGNFSQVLLDELIPIIQQEVIN